MVELILLENSSDRVVYRYLVEGKNEFTGSIGYNRLTEQYYIEELDQSKSGHSYVGHAISQVRKYVEADCFPEKDLRAWY
ncbi:hypothetical protein ACYSNR_04160 [Enterococcus sp. LJL128]|uniref:hypothetical protein n=1 Tax=Enterococcus sp. LJL51 TaxID=3416656 RepID=UPI003CECE113